MRFSNHCDLHQTAADHSADLLSTVLLLCRDTHGALTSSGHMKPWLFQIILCECQFSVSSTPNSSLSKQWLGCTAVLTQFDTHSLSVHVLTCVRVCAPRSIINCFSNGPRASRMTPRVPE